MEKKCITEAQKIEFKEIIFYRLQNLTQGDSPLITPMDLQGKFEEIGNKIDECPDYCLKKFIENMPYCDFNNDASLFKAIEAIKCSEAGVPNKLINVCIKKIKKKKTYEFENDQGAWIEYPEDVQQQLRERDIYEYVVPGTDQSYIVNVDPTAMFQMNKGTAVLRQVREKPHLGGKSRKRKKKSRKKKSRKRKTRKGNSKKKNGAYTKYSNCIKKCIIHRRSNPSAKQYKICVKKCDSDLNKIIKSRKKK